MAPELLVREGLNKPYGLSPESNFLGLEHF
jgi:hypothetical protein